MVIFIIEQFKMMTSADSKSVILSLVAKLRQLNPLMQKLILYLYLSFSF